MSELSKPTPGKGFKISLGLVAKSLLSGSTFAIAGLGAWGVILGTATRVPAFLPFAAPLMAAILIIAIAWLKFVPWPRSGARFRREAVPLRLVRPRIVFLACAWGWSMMLGGFLVYAAHRMIAGMGGESALALPHLRLAMLLPGLVMAGIVAGVIEEIAFRGFMQGMLARHFGIVPAILISGLAWAVFHTNHSYFGEEALTWVAIFMGVATMLGLIAYRTGSLIPGMIVHSGFDIAYFLAAGILAPRIAPIAYLESLGSPNQLLLIGGVLLALSIACAGAFFAHTRQASKADCGELGGVQHLQR